MEFLQLRDLIFSRIIQVLEALPKASLDGIYALSLYTDLGDTAEPELVFGYNSESQVEIALKSKDKNGFTASDADEARWNYAFWVQDNGHAFKLPELGDDGDLWKAICKQIGLSYSDADDFDIEEFEESTQMIVEELAVEVARSLHTSGAIDGIMGKKIPILVHGLEYHFGTIIRTKEANPPGLADAFLEWVQSH